MEAGWSGWRQVPGIICDRRIVARVKAKVHKIIVKPAKMQVSLLLKMD